MTPRRRSPDFLLEEQLAEVRLTESSQQEFVELPRTIRGRVDGLIERLRKWPEVSGVKPLRGDLAGHFRLRTGDYRLQFRVEGELIVIERIGHRDGFYGD